MRYSLIFLIFLLIISNLSSKGQDLSDSAEVYFVKDSFLIFSFGSETRLKSEEIKMLRIFSNFNYRDSLTFNPTDTLIIASLEKKIQEYIRLHSDSFPDCFSCQEIYKGYNMYDRQYFFFNRNKEKIVLVNFVLQLPHERHSTNRPCFISDGWYRYWRIFYNPETEKIEKLEINGRG